MASRRIPVPLRDRLEDLRRGPLVVAVWLAAVVGVGWLLVQQSATAEYRGLARAREHVVAAAADGILEDLAIELYQDVESGQVLATLDASTLEARLDTALKEIERLSAEVRAERVRLERDTGEALATRKLAERRLLLDEEEHWLDALAVTVKIESDRIKLERLALQAGRLEDLVESEAVSVALLDEVALRRDELREEIAGNEVLLAELEKARSAADDRRAQYEEAVPPAEIDDRYLEPLRLAVRVQEARVNELRLERENLVLVAPVAGRVSLVSATPGTVLAYGQTVLTVTERVPTEIVVYQPEADPRHVRAGDRVWIAPLADPLRRREALVVRLAPAVEALPARLWRNPSRPEYGRPFVLPVTDELGLTPGELVGVSFAR